MTSRWRGALGALCVGLCLVSAAGTATAEDDAESFVRTLSRIEASITKGRAEVGLRDLERLLSKHAQQAYARARKLEIADLAQRLAFAAEHPPPDPNTVTSGEIEDYDDRSHEITITYTRRTDGDLERSEAGLTFPACFTGPFEIVVRGEARPGDAPAMMVGGQEHPKSGKPQFLAINFGAPEYTKNGETYFVPASAILYDGDDETEIEGKEPRKGRSGGFTVELDVSKRKFKASYGGKVVVDGKKHKELFGWVTFQMNGWREIEISGEIEPSWLQSKIDMVMLQKKASFLDDYDASEHLPAWLFETPPARTRGDWPLLPDEVEGKHAGIVGRAMAALMAGSRAEALEHTEALRKAGAPAAACDYLEARAHLVKYDLPEALAALERCMEAKPAFLRGALLQGLLLRLDGEGDKATTALEVVKAAETVDPALFYELALGMLFSGRSNAAREVIRLAIENGAHSDTLEQIGRVLVKVDKGPGWARVFDYKTKRYHVVTDIDAETAKNVAQSLEQNYKIYQSQIGLVRREDRLFKVYVFSGQAGFLDYQRELQGLWGGGGHGAAGLYSPLLKQLLVWNLETRDAMLETVRHEGFHQYMDAALGGSAPTWLDEGLAVYYENAERDGGRLETGRPHPDYLALLDETEPKPLREFIHQSHEQFYEDGHHSYAQAWLFVHLLRHGSARNRRIFKELIDRLESESPSKVVKDLLPDDLLDRLDLELSRHRDHLDD